ncbi:MAG: hypothetical protein AAB415_02705, partial [Patescibacteria group bacterium]
MADKPKGAGFLNLNTLLSVLDPESRKLAQTWWASIPEGSPLKTELFERVFGIFKAWAETKAKGMGPIGEVIEKLTDIGDFAVRGGPKPDVKTSQAWMDRFFIDAGKRLEKTANPKIEIEKIKLEFELRRDLLKVIEEARKAAEPTKAEKVSFDWSKIQNQYEAFLLGVARLPAKVINQAVKIVVHLWGHGAGFTRMVIRLAVLAIVCGVVILLVWPFVLLSISYAGWYFDISWITAIAALVPLALLLVFVIAAVTIVSLAWPLFTGAAVVALGHEDIRTVAGQFVLIVFAAVFAELVFGLYLSVFQVWNWPILIPVLVLLVVVLVMFLILKRQFGFRQGGWFSTALALAILVVTVAFFFGGKGKEEAAEAVA